MNPLIPALALSGCVALAALGVALWRRPVEIAGLGPHEAATGDEAASERPGPMERASRSLAPTFISWLGPARVEAARRRLESAGRPAGLTVEGYLGRKALFTMLMAVVAVVFLIGGNLVAAALAVAAGWLWMDLWLGIVASQRQAQIDRDLPDFLDVLSVTVRAGSGLRSALSRVSEALGGPLGDEIRIALRQMDLGVGTRVAFGDVRRRNSSRSLGMFISALLQTEQLGAGLSGRISDLAADMRRIYHQEARRRAAKADPRVNLVVTTLIVPGTIILIITGMIAGTDIDLGNLLGPAT